MKYQAWFNGIAFNRAYVSAKDTSQPYPSFAELFPKKKSDEEIKAEEELSWAAERAEMAMILQANAWKQSPE